MTLMFLWVLIQNPKVKSPFFCNLWVGLSVCLHFDSLTLYLLVSSADNFCKQFGPRSGPTKCQA